jgi:hypothetical protein
MFVVILLSKMFQARAEKCRTEWAFWVMRENVAFQDLTLAGTGLNRLDYSKNR